MMLCSNVHNSAVHSYVEGWRHAVTALGTHEGRQKQLLDLPGLA